jgi:hypothetical protein
MATRMVRETPKWHPSTPTAKIVPRVVQAGLIAQTRALSRGERVSVESSSRFGERPRRSEAHVPDSRSSNPILTFHSGTVSRSIDEGILD